MNNDSTGPNQIPQAPAAEHDPATGKPILGRCLYCGCSDFDEPFVYCFEHEIVVRLYCSDIVACDQRQAREARVMDRGAA